MKIIIPVIGEGYKEFCCCVHAAIWMLGEFKKEPFRDSLVDSAIELLKESAVDGAAIA